MCDTAWQRLEGFKTITVHILALEKTLDFKLKFCPNGCEGCRGQLLSLGSSYTCQIRAI